VVRCGVILLEIELAPLSEEDDDFGSLVITRPYHT